MATTRSIHVRFTDEQWALLAHEAVRRRVPRGKLVCQLALFGFNELRSREESTRGDGGRAPESVGRP